MSSAESNKKKRKIASYSEKSLKQALYEIRENQKPIRAICREYGIPKTTILDRIKGRTTDSLKKPGPDPVIGKVGEKKNSRVAGKYFKMWISCKKTGTFGYCPENNTG